MQTFDPIAWLKPGCPNLRGSLREVETAIRRGQLAGPDNALRRQKLYQAIVTLSTDPDTNIRVRIRIARVLVAMQQQNIINQDNDTCP